MYKVVEVHKGHMKSYKGKELPKTYKGVQGKEVVKKGYKSMQGGGGSERANKYVERGGRCQKVI